MGAEENDRQYRVVDQMLSMHSMLRDSYNRKATWLSILLLVSSGFLCAVVFVGENVIKFLDLDPLVVNLGLGLTSVLLLVLSVVEFRVDWNGKAGRHDEAVRELKNLKLLYRVSYSKFKGLDQESNKRLSRKFDEVQRRITPIPDSKFAQLKAGHLYKIQLSQCISANPRAPLWFLKMKLRWNGMREFEMQPIKTQISGQQVNENSSQEL